MRDCAATVRVSSEMPDYARDSHGNLAEQMRVVGAAHQAPSRAAKPAPVVVAATPGGAELAQQQGCFACHAVDRKVVGPAFKDVAARYAGDGSASDRLAAKIRSGGSGAWGQVPMPAQPQVKDGEGVALVQWILSGGK
jgi:cytochrome c